MAQVRRERCSLSSEAPMNPRELAVIVLSSLLACASPVAAQQPPDKSAAPDEAAAKEAETDRRIAETLGAVVQIRMRALEDARSSATDRKSTRLNSSHLGISYAVFCLKKK